MQLSFRPLSGNKSVDNTLAGIKGKIESRSRQGAEKVAAGAREILRPVYENRAGLDWQVTGALRRGITVEKEGGGWRVFVSGPASKYARRLHFVNRAHPTAVGYLIKPLTAEVKRMQHDLKKILRGE